MAKLEANFIMKMNFQEFFYVNKLHMVNDLIVFSYRRRKPSTNMGKFKVYRTYNMKSPDRAYIT